MNEANEAPFDFEGVLRKTMSENPAIAELGEVIIKKTGNNYENLCFGPSA